MTTPNAILRLNGESLPTWTDGQLIYASEYQPAVNWGVDGIRKESYLVEMQGQKQRIPVRFVEFLPVVPIAPVKTNTTNPAKQFVQDVNGLFPGTFPTDEEMRLDHIEGDVNTFDRTEGEIPR